MKRTQRNLFIIMTVMVGVYLILIRLPLQITVWIAGALLAGGVMLIVWGRDFFMGRRCTRRRQWKEAAQCYERFEKKLLSSPWPRLTVPLYLGIYTFDGVAIARNNVAQSLMNSGDLPTAQRWLRSALMRDPMYAIPYVNLGIIAAMKGDKHNAEREMLKAVHLGYSPTGAQRALRRALQLGNESIGRIFDDR